ncbi:glycosyltransferase family 39 protein [Paenibacillus sp. sgz500958]|uniref:glycosyltransferase family 39 protein n=1 Tax=Paenibacillus sp. sgz500958 TaxID=3242475 RepID=UPI0036D3B43A
MGFIKKLGSDRILLIILLLAAFLYGYGIWNDQYANTYYTTAVGSMLQSFHNFFYASLDSAGSVTVDKPPVTFWIQTLSASIFGLYGWSVILPQVLGGMGSVLLVYLMVKPAFGRTAASLAALAMATTPVAAAVSRTNNIDAMLVFTLLLAAWFLFRGIRRNRIGNLMAAFALIGVGFNEKMLQAYMVLPAFYLFYILAAKVNWKKKTGVLAACTAVLLVVSLSWTVIVDAIPASKRPFIGSSGTNSVLNLAFGYNGVSRLTGDRSTGGGTGGAFPGMNGNEMPSWNGSTGGRIQGQAPGNGAQGQMPGSGMQGQIPGNGTRGQMPGNGADGQGRQFGADGGQGNRGGMNAGGGGMFNTGTAGPLRLFQSELSGQASWLLPFVLFGCIALFAGLRRKNFTQKHKEAVFWLAWLVPAMGFFSIAGFFHQYYLIMMAPPIAALAGAGWAELWQAYRARSGWLSWLLPAATLVTAVFQWYIIHPYDETIGSGWSIGILAGGILVTGVLVVIRSSNKPFVYAAGVAGLMVLLVGPLYWAATPITYGSNSMTPIAGPDGASGGMGGGFAMNGGGMPGGQNGQFAGLQGGALQGRGAPNSGAAAGANRISFGRGITAGVNENLLAYLKEHNSGQKYLFAAMDYGTAGPYIIDEDASVVILNGFNASDTVYTADTLRALVESGQVKYFLVSSGGMGGGGRGGNSELTSWITENGTEVPAAEWQGTEGGGTLYEVTLN